MRLFHKLPPEEYAKLDIGEVNLECADKLPGSEHLNVQAHLATLDEWADAVRQATERWMPRFDRNPVQFHHSMPYFRMLILVSVLQRDFGVAYKLESLEGPFDATDSRLHFIHGILEGFGGTCTSLPVLYVAIGRRLGYPLKLVPAVEHLFVRWDDSETGEKLNIEATSPGLNCHADEYYHTWPKPVRAEDVEAGWVLRSMPPEEELACFYGLRASCFFDWCKFDNAFELAHAASKLLSFKNPFLEGQLSITAALAFRDAGTDKIGVKQGTGGSVVLETRVERRANPEDPWAIRQAKKELMRGESIHRARKRQGTAMQFAHPRDVAFAEWGDFQIRFPY